MHVWKDNEEMNGVNIFDIKKLWSFQFEFFVDDAVGILKDMALIFLSIQWNAVGVTTYIIKW